MIEKDKVSKRVSSALQSYGVEKDLTKWKFENVCFRLPKLFLWTLFHVWNRNVIGFLFGSPIQSWIHTNCGIIIKKKSWNWNIFLDTPDCELSYAVILFMQRIKNNLSWKFDGVKINLKIYIGVHVAWFIDAIKLFILCMCSLCTYMLCSFLISNCRLSFLDSTLKSASN